MELLAEFGGRCQLNSKHQQTDLGRPLAVGIDAATRKVRQASTFDFGEKGSVRLLVGLTGLALAMGVPCRQDGSPIEPFTFK